MKSIFTTLFVLLVFFAVGQDKIQFSGVVLDSETNKPVKNYTVEYFSISHKVLNTIHPESDGTFKITLAYDVSDKFYFIIKSPGYLDNKKAIRMQRYEANEDVELNFYLSR